MSNDIGLNIPLGIYTIKAKTVLENFIYNYLYNPGSRGVDCYSWDETVISFSQAPNGEICLNIKKENDWRIQRSSWRARYNVIIAKKFFIYSIEKACKRIIKRVYNDVKLEWNINCKTNLDYYQRYAYSGYYKNTHVTVGDLKAIFETMLGRKHMIKKITNEQRETLIGHKRNPIETELEIARLDEIERITDEYNAERQKLDKERQAEYNTFYAKLDKKYDELKYIAKEKYAKKLSELNSMAPWLK